MNFRITHKLHGRIRLNCGRYAFTKKSSLALLSALQEVKGVNKAEVSVITGSVVIVFVPGELPGILDFIRNLQLGTLEKEEIHVVINTQDEDFFIALTKKTLFRYVVRPLLPPPVRTAIVFWNAFKFVRKGLAQLLIQKKIGVEVLDAAAITTSLLQGSRDTASSIMFLLTVSEMIESWTEKKSKASLAQSLAVHIDKIWVERDGVEMLVHAASVGEGDVVVVRTGALIPVDGRVIRGEAMVNQSGMTGEPLPVKRDFGKTVFAGTTVEEGCLYIEVTAAHSDTRINRIIKMIDESENFKSSWQSRNEHIADSIVPFSFLGALGVYLFTGSFAKAASILLVDYSCAIKLSTSLTVLSALRETAAHNVVVKGGKFLEAIAEADTIVFDKTGTLTEAKPVIMDIIPLDGYSRDEVLKIAACLEEHFPHSVAQAVVQKAVDEGIDHKEEHAEVEYIIAHGIASRLNNKRVLIGSEHFIFEDEGVLLSESDRLILDEKIGSESTLYLAIDHVLAGVILVNDPVKPDARQMIANLSRIGFNRIIMLTGDSERNAAVVAEQLGIKEFCAQMLPEHKAEYIARLRQEGNKVMMVGDGVNDAPALSAANVAVSMQNGSDIAREVADVAMFTLDLNELVSARLISRAVMGKIKTNYRMVVTFNSLLLLLGLNQLISPALSATLHNASTIGIGIKSLLPVLK